jgi:hypothetical protein
VFRDGDQLELASRNERPFTRYFPELIEPLLAQLPERCVVDGEIVVPDATGRGLDFDALLQRIIRPNPGCDGSPPRHRRRSWPSTCWRSRTGRCSTRRCTSDTHC